MEEFPVAAYFNQMSRALNTIGDNQKATAENLKTVADNQKMMADNQKTMADNLKTMADDITSLIVHGPGLWTRCDCVNVQMHGVMLEKNI